MSASCTKKTCWKVAPNLHTVGEKLFTQFHTAIKVTPHNFESPFRRKRTHHNHNYEFDYSDVGVNEVRKKDLIYFEETPNICSERPDMIRNRRCNRTSLLTDGCDLMCCNGRYRTVTETKPQQCQCKFIYCCRVECQTCMTKIETSYCI